MGNALKKRKKQHDRANLLYKQLMGTYPVLRQYKTLEVGVKSKLIEAVHNNTLLAETSVYIVELFLRKYTNSSKYLKNALKFKARYDLEDNKIEDISEKDLSYFKKALKKNNKNRVNNLQHKYPKPKIPRNPIISLNRS